MSAMSDYADDPGRLAVLLLVVVAVAAFLWLCGITIRRARVERRDGEFLRDLCDGRCEDLSSSRAAGPRSRDAQAAVAKAIDAHVRADPSLDRHTRALYAATLRAIADRRTTASDPVQSDD